MMQKKSLILILNPNAKENRRNPPPLEQIRKIIGDKSKIFLTQDLNELHLLFENELKNVNHLLEEGFDLCFLGGDGSISRGLSAAYRAWGPRPRYPRILTVRAGTINMICNELGMKHGVETTLEKFMQGEFQQMRHISSMKIALHSEPAFLGFILAAGVGYRVLKEYYSKDSDPGVAKGIWVASKTLLSTLHPNAASLGMFKKLDLNLTIDGMTFENQKAYSLVLGTLSRISLGLRPLPLKKSISEASVAVSVNSLPLWKVALHAPKLLFGVGEMTSINETGCIYSNSRAKNIEFQLDEGFTLDGEMFSLTQKTKLSICPGPVFTFYQE